MTSLGRSQATPFVDLSKFDNAWYDPGGVFKRSLWYVCSRLFFKTHIPYPSSLKRSLLRRFGARVGSGFVIKPDVNIKFPWLLEVGNNVWIGEGAWIDNLARVKFGNNVCISQGAYILTGNHNYKKVAFDLIVSPVTVEDGVWIGAKTVICPGVVLKTHSVITVGSIMHKDADAFMIYSGNPAVPTRRREIL